MKNKSTIAIQKANSAAKKKAAILSLAESPLLNIKRVTIHEEPDQEFDTDRSVITLKAGDVVALEGGKPWIVELSGPSRARCIPLTGQAVKVKLDDREFMATKYNQSVSISQRVCRSVFLERAGGDLLNLFLAVKKGSYRMKDSSNNETQEPEENNTMKAIKGLPKGGLVADAIRAKAGEKAAAKATKTKKNPEGSKGKLGALFGHSITAVIRSLAKAGLDFTQVVRALKSQKIEAAEGTVKIQIGRGLRGDQPPADLTKEQLAGLVKAAGDPAPEAKKAEKPAKKAKAEKAPKKASKATKVTAATTPPAPEPPAPAQ